MQGRIKQPLIGIDRIMIGSVVDPAAVYPQHLLALKRRVQRLFEEVRGLVTEEMSDRNAAQMKELRTRGSKCHRGRAQAYNDGNLAAIGKYYAEDLVKVGQGGPVEAKVDPKLAGK